MAALVVFVVDVGVLASGVVLDSIGGGLLASSCTGICVTSSHKFQVFVGVVMEVVGVVGVVGGRVEVVVGGGVVVVAVVGGGDLVVVVLLG